MAMFKGNWLSCFQQAHGFQVCPALTKAQEAVPDYIGNFSSALL
jgi:hypothetical protein